MITDKMEQNLAKLSNRDAIIDALPSGSGFDRPWKAAPGNHYIGAFHVMNENGYYTYWVDIDVHLFEQRTWEVQPLHGPLTGRFLVLSMPGDIRAEISYSSSPIDEDAFDRAMTCEYIDDCIFQALQDANITSPAPSMRLIPKSEDTI